MVGKDWATLAIAVAGLVLGIYNAIRAWCKDRPRITVEGRLETGADGNKSLLIKLVNTGSVPVLIKDLAIGLRNNPRRFPKVAFEAEGGNDVWKNQELRPCSLIAVRSAIVPANFMDHVTMAYADSILVTFADGSVHSFRCDDLKNSALQKRLEFEIGKG